MTEQTGGTDGITVALHGYFSRAFSGSQRTLVVPLADAGTPRAVIDHLAIQPGAVGLVLVNGAQASLDTPLHAGDRLDILPLLGGG